MEAFHSSLFRNLGQYRIIRQGDLARNFSSQMCCENAGILCVFQGQYRTIRQESLTREFASEKGGKPPEYFVYCKVFGRISGGKAPSESAGAIVRCCHSFHSGFVEEKNRQSPQTQLCGVAFVFSRYPDIIRRQGAWRNE